MSQPVDVDELVRTMLPNVKPDDPNMPAYRVLVASDFYGANELLLASILKMPHSAVIEIGSRLRKAGIWKGDVADPRVTRKWAMEGYFEKDAAIAAGTMPPRRSRIERLKSLFRLNR